MTLKNTHCIIKVFLYDLFPRWEIWRISLEDNFEMVFQAKVMYKDI